LLWRPCSRLEIWRSPMRVLLDECVPERLREDLIPHVVRTVPEMGWAGIKNGELLQLASSDFDCFLTVDRNLQFQQHIGNLPLAILVIEARNSHIEALRTIMPRVIEALASIAPRELKIVWV
jgi:predicted nuclease of predicted toxin-antitoxin system